VRRSGKVSINRTLKPSPLVRRFASQISEAAAGLPILDVACGSGRNAVFLHNLDCTVICVDNDLTRFQTQDLPPSQTSVGKLVVRQLDLVNDDWPFGECSLGGIISVHFLLPALFPRFEHSLSPGGYLLLETVPGCGDNYLELPKAGWISSCFRQSFDLEFYQEGKVGPRGSDAVTFKMIARRRPSTR